MVFGIGKSSHSTRALGTDTGGSIRLPAAYTGTVGFKPSYGMVSRWGVVAHANSLDTVGVLARNSSMARKMFGKKDRSHEMPTELMKFKDVVKGYDSYDPTSIPPDTRSRIAQKLIEHKAKLHWGDRPFLRIGVPKEYNTEEMQPVVRQAWLATLQGLRKLGHAIHLLSLPATKMALSAYYVIAPAEASSNLAKYDGVRYGTKASDRDGTDNVLYASTRGAGLGEEVKRRILLGSYSLSAAAIDNYFIQAQKIRRLLQRDFNDSFAMAHPLMECQDDFYNHVKVDIIMTPTAQTLAPKLNSLVNRSALEVYSADVLTVPASLAGLPAMSVPVSILRRGGNDQNGPSTVGMQVIGQFGDDELVFYMSEIIESLSM